MSWGAGFHKVARIFNTYKQRLGTKFAERRSYEFVAASLAARLTAHRNFLTFVVNFLDFQFQLREFVIESRIRRVPQVC